MRHNTFLLQGRKGFTLLEVVISILIIGIVIGSTLHAIAYANVISIETREMTSALNDARAILDRIKVTPLASLPQNGTVDASALWNIATFTENALASQQIQVAGGAGTTLREMTVTVTWIGPRNKTMQLEFTTLKSLLNG